MLKLLIFGFFLKIAYPCTTLIVGKKASVDNKVMCS